MFPSYTINLSCLLIFTCRCLQQRTSRAMVPSLSSLNDLKKKIKTNLTDSIVMKISDFHIFLTEVSLFLDRTHFTMALLFTLTICILHNCNLDNML